VHLHFDASMEAEIAERLTIENELRLALERGELRVHYQPIVDAVGSRVSGCEALVRWQHPTRGLTFPDVFLPVAEETGLIVDIDRWVMEEAIRATCTIRALLPDFGVAVNVSPRALCEAGFGDDVLAAAGRHGLPLEALTIEITEKVVVEPGVVPMLNRLVAAGVRIAIDDFGVGYSSLSYLADLPIGMIKLDRSFLRDVAVDPRSRSLVRSIVALAKGLALDVVAEGVETADQLRFVRSAGCLSAQGYWFSKPLPLNEFAVFLNESAPVAVAI